MATKSPECYSEPGFKQSSVQITSVLTEIKIKYLLSANCMLYHGANFFDPAV
jgi:hypothetical protein